MVVGKGLKHESIYKTSRRPSLVSKFAVVAEKSSRKSTPHCENGGCRGCFWGYYSAGTENTISRQPGRVLRPSFMSGGSQELFYDTASRSGIIRFFSPIFLFFSMYPGIKKNNLKYHVLPDLEVKWQYYHHQIRGKCSPEQVLESPYSAWLANASSSRLTNCS
jgi:hypothetical protein